MARLRAECGWKAAQTHRTLARHLLEETYETLEVIEAEQVDDDHLRRGARRPPPPGLPPRGHRGGVRPLRHRRRRGRPAAEAAAPQPARLRRRREHRPGAYQRAWESVKAQEKQRESTSSTASRWRCRRSAAPRRCSTGSSAPGRRPASTRPPPTSANRLLVLVGEARSHGRRPGAGPAGRRTTDQPVTRAYPGLVAALLLGIVVLSGLHRSARTTRWSAARLAQRHPALDPERGGRAAPGRIPVGQGDARARR